MGKTPIPVTIVRSPTPGWARLLEFGGKLAFWAVTGSVVWVIGLIVIPQPEHVKYGYAFCFKTKKLEIREYRDLDQKQKDQCPKYDTSEQLRATEIYKIVDADKILLPPRRDIRIYDTGAQHGFEIKRSDTREIVEKTEDMDYIFFSTDDSPFFIEIKVMPSACIEAKDDKDVYSYALFQVSNQPPSWNPFSKRRFDRIREIVNCDPN